MLSFWQTYSGIMQNALISSELQRIWVIKTFKIEIKNWGPNNSDFLQNWFPPEIRSCLSHSCSFEKCKKCTPASRKMYWNLMNDEEFESLKFLKLKYKRGDQTIQTFCRTGSPLKLGPFSLICRNSKTLTEVLLNHAECIEI